MIDEFECKGRWRIPGDETWYNGTLKFSPDAGTTLEIFGTFNQGFLQRQTKVIILGETNKGDITLVDNLYRTTRFSFEPDVTIGIYKPNYIIVGHHFESLESIRFKTVTFSAFNLFEWFDISGLKHSIKKQTFSVDYLKPSELSFEYFDGCRGIVDFTYLANLQSTPNKIEVEEGCLVTFKYVEKRMLRDILMDIHTFNGFLTFVTFEQSYPLSISFSDIEYEKNGKPKTIECSYNNPAYGKQYKSRRKGEHLIDYSDIKDDFPLLIRNWYKRNQEIRPVFSLLLYSFKDKLKFSEDKFMDIVRAVETFHRRTTNCTKLSKEEFDSMVQRIYNKIDPKDKQWLVKQNAFTYQNEFSLKNRLLDLFVRYSNSYLKDKIPNINRFCVQVVNSRNYYTHYNADKEGMALKGKKLFELSQDLKALLICCICKDIGLNDSLLILEGGLRRNL